MQDNSASLSLCVTPLISAVDVPYHVPSAARLPMAYACLCDAAAEGVWGAAAGEGRDEDPLEMELAAELSQEEFHRPGADGQKLDDPLG